MPESYWDVERGGLISDPSKAAIAKNEIVYSSYSGADIVAEIVLPGESPLTLGELQTISYSLHRDNTPVRFLGRVNPQGFLKGPRTIAGSLIFTVFNNYAFYRLGRYKDALQRSNQTLYPLADMLPPFDVVITFANESGSFSKMKILGVTIVDEGQTMSIDDMIVEQTYTFMARGLQPITRYLPESFMPHPQALERYQPSRSIGSILRFI